MSLILTVNAGSSSIKFDLFETEDLKKLFEATVKNIGSPSANIVITNTSNSDKISHEVTAPDHAAAAEILANWLNQQASPDTVTAIGHRIVHGGPKYFEPCVINDELVTNLRNLTLFDPEHLPIEVQLIETFQKLIPGAKQVACFDTAFHHNLPNVARLLPIPRRYEAQGLRRYGFHGLSYSYTLQELRRLAGQEVADGRIIIAHLGSGASLAAVHHGQSIDTTMGLTPTSGVPMSTRSGDLDPGLALYLAESEHMDARQFNNLVNFQSGLLGISETSADMKELLDREAEDNRAKDAIDMFCYQVKKSIGGLAAALGGLDALVFTGGIGEDAPKIRARICDGLQFLGIQLNEPQNLTNANIISADSGKIEVRIIHANEALVIAQNVKQIVANR